MFKQSSVLICASILLSGCGGEGNSVAEKTGDSIGQAVTDFSKGVGSGVDKGLNVEVELTEEGTKLGFTTTVAKRMGVGESKGIHIYILSEKVFDAKLIAKAINPDGLEVGRSVVNRSFAEDDGVNVAFKFESAVDMLLIDKFILDVKELDPSEIPQIEDVKLEPTPEAESSETKTTAENTSEEK